MLISKQIHPIFAPAKTEENPMAKRIALFGLVIYSNAQSQSAILDCSGLTLAVAAAVHAITVSQDNPIIMELVKEASSGAQPGTLRARRAFISIDG
jgi:hypothetical protein